MIRINSPKIICLCGSTRFKQTFEYYNMIETLSGNIVLSVGCFIHHDSVPIDHMKKQLDELHLRKIDIADEVFILNEYGYIGESTRSEIKYAESKNKKIRYLITPQQNKEKS